MQDQVKEIILRPKNLTPREQQVLEHIVYGKSNQEIAATLGLSVKTIEWHRLNLMKKLGAHKTADLVRYALRYQLIESNGGK